MNTKQAVAKYGRWAVDAGFQAWRRATHGVPKIYATHKALAGHTVYTHNQCLSSGNVDYPYDASTIKAIATRARLRQP